jgi:CheY-like chemotaxis protein
LAHLARVIVVEDDPQMRRIITKVLASQGMVVRAVSDGLEALTAFDQSRNEPDLLCADIRMPNMDGKELARHLRQQGVGVPIIFVSGTISREQEGYRERSHVHLVAKPFSTERLAEIAKEMLARPRPEVGPRTGDAPQAPAAPQALPPTPRADDGPTIAPSNLPVVPLSPLKGFHSGDFPAQGPAAGGPGRPDKRTRSAGQPPGTPGGRGAGGSSRPPGPTTS